MDWFTATMDELRKQLASVGAQATGPAGGLFAREPFTDARGLATLYIPARAYGALISGSGPIRERYLDIAPDGASGRTEIAWPVLRMAG